MKLLKKMKQGVNQLISIKNNNSNHGMSLKIFLIILIGTSFFILSGCQNSESPTEVSTIPKVLLENQQDHSCIQITIVEADTSVYTSIDGTYTLPLLNDGTWTISAQYPYYIKQEQTIEIIDGEYVQPINTMTLMQLIDFQVTMEKESYAIGEDVEFTLVSTNVTDKTTTLWSPRTSMAASAVRKDGETIAGFLTPGQAAAVDTRTFQANSADTTLLKWRTSKEPPPGPGNYEIFAVLVAKQIFVDNDTTSYGCYFVGRYSSDTTCVKLKKSLYTKLDPTTVILNP